MCVFSDRASPAVRHRVTGFQRRENLILDPIVLPIASLRFRNILSGTVAEILAKAAARPDRRIVIAPADAHKPVLCQVPYGDNYRDDNRASRAVQILTYIGELCYIAGVFDVLTRYDDGICYRLETSGVSQRSHGKPDQEPKFRACLVMPIIP